MIDKRAHRRGVLLVSAALFASIAVAHELVATGSHRDHVIHVVLRTAYIVPVIVAAIWYGLSGGLSAALLATALYVAHVLRRWDHMPWENVNQIAMVAVYVTVGPLTGALVHARRRAEAMRRMAEHAAQRTSLVSGLSALESALKYRDGRTAVHGEEVASLAAGLAARVGLSPERIELVRQAGRVHDLGKIGVRDDVLYKPERLSDEEARRMRAHPEIAADILSAVPGTEPLARIVAAHHEYLDGSGYPKGLSGDEISLEAQLLTVSDVFCALTEDRPYHPRRSSEEALALLDSWVPERLSGDIVAALRGVLANETAPVPSTAGPGTQRLP